MKKTSARVTRPFRKVPWRKYGPQVIGVDEVGRGCVAGPVYAAAVLFTHGALEREVTDSKLLTEARREELSAKIWMSHHAAVGVCTVEEIDELNILQASLLAMKRAIFLLQEKLAKTEWSQQVLLAPVVIDGNTKIPDFPVERQNTLVKGDLRCAPISAASIVAKVARDRLMKEEGLRFPEYQFATHKGYGTEIHREALQKWGPCAIHRKSFAGVKELLIRNLDELGD